MKLYYDCEFLEDGKTIQLISIGMIREDGKKLYRVVNDPELIINAYQHMWLRRYVIPSLPISIEYTMHDIDDTYKNIVVWDSHHPDYHCIKTRNDVAQDVKRFVVNTPNPELWAYYGAYDHVALCQLFGRMVDLPIGIPMYTNDLRSEIQRMNNPEVPEQLDGLHNALADATWNKDTHEYLQGLQRAKESLLEPSDK